MFRRETDADEAPRAFAGRIGEAGGFGMTELNRIPEDSLVVVCDSRKALFLTNTGTPIRPSLRTEDHMEAPASAAEDSDRPGRRFDGGRTDAGFHARSAMEAPDLDREHAAEFAALLAGRLAKDHRDGAFRHLVVAAPPEFLGLLRDEMAAEVAGTVLAEIPKRLTDVPVGKIAGKLVDGW